MTEAYRHETGLDAAMDQIFTPRERSEDAQQGRLGSLLASWKIQAVAAPFVVLATLPGALLVTGLLFALPRTEPVAALVLFPYLGVFIAVETTTAATLSQFTISWDAVGEVATGDFRTADSTEQQLRRIIILCISGVSVLSIVAMLAGVLSWLAVGQLWPAGGVVAALCVPLVVIGLEELLLSRWDVGISFVGIWIAERLITAISELSARDRAMMDSLSATAKLFVVAAVTERPRA